MSMDSSPAPASAVDAAHQRMSDWFGSVSYVEDYAGQVPVVDDPQDDQD